MRITKIEYTSRREFNMYFSNSTIIEGYHDPDDHSVTIKLCLMRPRWNLESLEKDTETLLAFTHIVRLYPGNPASYHHCYGIGEYYLVLTEQQFKDLSTVVKLTETPPDI